MKIVGTSFAIFLIAGILSCCSIAWGEDAKKEDKGLLESIVSIKDRNFSQETNNKIHMMELMKASCEKNYPESSMAFDTAKMSLESFDNCMNAGMNRESVANMHENMQYEKYGETYCVPIENMDKCIKKIRDCVVPCLDPKERKEAKVLYNIIHSAVESLCDGNGTRITEFYINGGEECIETNGTAALFQCVAEVYNDGNTTTMRDNKVLRGVGMLKLIPTEGRCTVMETFQQCIVDVFENCEKKEPANIINSVFNSVKKAIECEELSKSKALQTAEVGNVLLLSLITGITALRFV